MSHLWKQANTYGLLYGLLFKPFKKIQPLYINWQLAAVGIKKFIKIMELVK